MKKQIMIGMMGTLLMTGCQKNSQKVEEPFDYTVEQFADLQLLRYKVHGFEELPLQQKELVYYLSEAALQGRDILFDQNGKYNLIIRKMLEAVYTDYQGDRADTNFVNMETYLKRVWFSNGIHHHYAADKFVPGFTPEFFKSALQSVDVSTLPLAEGETLETLCDEVFPVIFDPKVMPKRVNQADGEDLVLTSAANYYAGVTQKEAEAFYAKMRNYPSVRAMHLHHGNIPESVYDNLIETVHKHLPAMHRYVALRKKLLGVDRLHMYDLYVPVVEENGKSYPYDEAKEIVKAALAPMGEEYVKVVSAGMDKDWVDVYENQNKRSGAYSWGAYGTHPYVLLNHQDNLDSVFTLAHEMGHAMHSYLSDKNQSITYAGYLIFVAEVASTCNEALLMHYLLENTTDEKDRKYLINHQLESFRGTLFRQTMFAEFEKIVHDRMAAGESLTKDDLCKIYHDLNVMYYGPDIIVDEEIDYEWMRIPHFYTSFYVYQYATGYSAAIAFSKKILEEGKPAVDRYIDKFLSGGGSKDPIDLLKDAGVDMSSPVPVDDALNVFESYLEMFEKMV